MKQLITKILAILAQRILRAYRPRVIGITGSVGKTSVKDAIAFVLRNHASVRASIKNFNNELGVPLTIIGVADSPGRSLFRWCSVFLRAIRLLIFSDPMYPKLLILEMGADQPGDISLLTRIAPCNIGVLTAIGPAHLEKFGTMEVLVREKKQLIEHLREGATAIINIDDPFIYPLNCKTSARILSYGYEDHADMRVSDANEQYCFSSMDGCAVSLSFSCSFRDQFAVIELHNVIGKQIVYAVLAALSVACILDIPLVQAAHEMRGYIGPKGRMRLLSGMKRTLIIDDSYNSSPVAAREALTAMNSFRIDESARRIAVLGDMLELGRYTENEHRKIGAYCANCRIDTLITVGPAAKFIAKGAVDAGIDKTRIVLFDTAEEVGDMLRNMMCQGDIILVKGSQGIRMEKIVKEIMAEPERAGELLVRQGKEWQ